MGLPLALAIGSTAISFMGSMNAARAAKREAALQRRQLQNQIEGAQLAAIQDHNARMRNLQIFQATNESLVGVSGRDMGSDRSFKAIQEKAKREMATETDRKFLQTLEQVGQLSLSQSIATEKGRNLSRAYKYQAFGTLFSGAMKAQPLMPSTPATTTTPTFYGNTFDRAF
jgi:type II secretory pathway pseudopilin PulG